MNKSKKNLAVLCTAIFVILGMWVMLSVHCQAAETNNDEKQQTQTIRCLLYTSDAADEL